MAKMLSVEKIKEVILGYVNDTRKKQAILLDGDWGCGKTFFLKETLIPALEKDEAIMFFKLSLYGISDVKTIQEMVYASWIEKYVHTKTQNMGSFGNVITKGVNIFGKSAINYIENKIGIEDTIDNLTGKIIDEKLAKDSKVVFIFDDIERCQIEIIELMGYLNDLCENNGFKLILVANEKEINRRNDISETALKYSVSLNTRLKTDNIVEKKADISGTNGEKTFTKEELERVSNYIFGQECLYERTREKLVGLTIPYSLSVSEALKPIVEEYIQNKELQNTVLLYKSDVVEMFERFQHRNLRTLIAACIATEDILGGIEKDKYNDQHILEDEIKTIILYIIYSAIRKATGKSLFIWSKDNRYTCVNNSFSLANEMKIYGYAFVDEYWFTQCVDKEIIYRDISERVNSELEFQTRRKKDKEHSNLALFQLNMWHYLSDEEVKKLVVQMKDELAEKKYYPQEFRDIICTLISINNPNFGLKHGEGEMQNDATVYDITEESQFANMHLEKIDIVDHMYSDWEEYNINEYVELMLKYFDDPEFTMNNKMIRVLSKDKLFAYRYRVLVLPILRKIKKIEMDNTVKNDDGNEISDLEWDDSFEKFVSKKKDEFMSRGRFLSLFDLKKFIERLNNANANNIYCLAEGIKIVYSFSNIGDVYSSDLSFVDSILQYISKNIGVNINVEKSRTKEIAISCLVYDLKKYQERLSTD